ncbi:MAG: MerR family transcriptional regulator [Peptococcaceae bacterium]|jgi:DNA-binding transcriptional MerR regulator|nr:MerR family transcriptional regulator [Peptococcaceae bacterium]
MLRIGELAHRTGVSVRTLHHYHHLGLLVPSVFSEAEHRFYTKDDVLRLQQILALKHLGFSLEKIKELLESANYKPGDPTETMPKIFHRLLTDTANDITEEFKKIMALMPADGEINEQSER